MRQKPYQHGGYKSIAIICKTMDECKKVKNYFDKEGRIPARLLTGEEVVYHVGVTLVYSYVAKGLEFDVVFIVNIDDKYSSAGMDVKLMYVAMTRALHKLYVYYKESTIPLLDGIEVQANFCCASSLAYTSAITFSAARAILGRAVLISFLFVTGI